MWDTGETWIADFSGEALALTKFEGVGENPYDALITGDGRRYIVGLFGEDGLTAFDLVGCGNPRRAGYWRITGAGRRICRFTRCRILKDGRLAGDRFVLPAVGPSSGSLDRCG